PDDLDINEYPDYLWTMIPFKDFIGPERYLQDAIDDLKSGDERRHYNNALRNAKSALHMRVDILCYSFGGESFFKKMKSFPRKLDFLESIGIVRPRIIDKINKVRNEFEHEYKNITKEEAEDFVDIVMLFIEATKYLNFRFPSEIVFIGLNKEGNKEVIERIYCNFSNGEIILCFRDCGAKEKGIFIKHSIFVEDNLYREWLKYIIINNE
ncbi:TPA: hypothetical protein OT831_005068, partial [Klebsiella pneumoniae]|nr:hypothetical protein [Klebsiella pneumoniae]